MFFYELHEGDDEVYSDVLVVSESEWEPQEFFELVQRIRHDVQHGYEQDTLIEAIALVLERDYGFIYVSDDRLAAAVNVSTQEADNFLADLTMAMTTTMTTRRTRCSRASSGRSSPTSIRTSAGRTRVAAGPRLSG